MVVATPIANPTNRSLKMTKTSIILALWIGILLSACSDTHPDFSRFTALPRRGWAYGDTIAITPEQLDSVNPKQLMVAVTHSEDYPYRNLWLELRYDDASGRQHVDSVNIEMADIYGRWLGNGIGAMYQREVPVASNVNPKAGSSVRIRHVMRVDTLRGLQHIGITLAE